MDIFQHLSIIPFLQWVIFFFGQLATLQLSCSGGVCLKMHHTECQLLKNSLRSRSMKDGRRLLLWWLFPHIFFIGTLQKAESSLFKRNVDIQTLQVSFENILDIFGPKVTFGQNLWTWSSMSQKIGSQCFYSALVL